MKVWDIGLLFDISSSMSSPFRCLSKNNSYKRSDELINILEKICSRGNRLKNEQIRIFSILFGGKNTSIYDFCNLLKISNEKFRHNLTSSAYTKPSYYGNKLKEVLSEGKKTLKLDQYLQCENGPSERLCEMGYYLLKDDYSLCNEIYDSLPSECKSNLKDIGIGVGNIFGIFDSRINNATIDVINTIYEKCINKYISFIIREETNARKMNGNKFIFLDGNHLINIKKNLENKLTSPNNSNINILDLFKDYIYGNTPLYTALNSSFDNFKNQSSDNNHKYLFIISDGELNDIEKNFDYIGEIRKKAENNNIIIVSIFLTSNSIPKEEILYDIPQSHFTSGSKDLFLMSTSLTYEHPIIKFFIQKGWNIPVSGECKLFVEINNSQNLNKFIDILNEAIGEVNNRNNQEIIKNPNSLINLLSSTVIDNYVNSDVINKFKAKEQIGGTCYANAIAAAICLASARVYGRPKLDFFEVRKKIIDIYGDKGGNTFQILKEYLHNYKLHCQEVNEEGARKAVMKTRPCVAKFSLTAQQWGNFSDFYKINKKGILTSEILNENKEHPKSTPGGHAVVLTHISKDYLTFLNSWGSDWADNGYFRVKNAAVLGMSFCDIFWYISDLSQNEIDSYNKHMQKLKKEIDNFVYD